MSAVQLIILILMETQITSAGLLLARLRRDRKKRGARARDINEHKKAPEPAEYPEQNGASETDAFEAAWRDTFESMLAYDMETAKKAAGGAGE